MSQSGSTTKALTVLHKLSASFMGKAKALPVEGEDVITRSFIHISILKQNIVIAVEEVAEILEMQGCTRLPRVKKWVRGVANVRGRLLPVIDFAEFLDAKLLTASKLQRIVVIEMEDVYVGLLVDQVFGVRHLRVDGYADSAKGIPEVLSTYVEGCFLQDGEQWLLMRPPRLVNDPIFMEVAA